MQKEDMVVHDSRLGIEGTIPWLVDTAVRYSDDYSDEALEKISQWAKNLGFDENTARIPLLVKAGRKREKKIPKTLPLEEMQIDKLRGFQIGYSETMEYGELEIREEGDKVLISIIGTDEDGHFSAANAYSVDEFMAAEGNWLEVAIGYTLSAREYEEENNVPEKRWENTDLFRISREHQDAGVDAWGGYIGKNDGFTPFGWTITAGNREYFFDLGGKLVKEKAL